MWLAVTAGFLADMLISWGISSLGSLFDSNLRNGVVSFATTAGIVTAILLVLSTGLGGWLAGRIAKRENVLHGVLVGGLGIFALLIASFSGERLPLADIVLQIVAVGVGGLGGWLSRWIPARQE